MKKTLLALAVLAAAGSAQAGIEIYNNEGVTVNLKGDIEITYQNSTKSASMSQQIEDADFGFDVRYAINDQVSFGAMWEFNGSDTNNEEWTKNGDNYVALYTADFGSIKLGRLCTAIDDIGIGNDYQFGIDAFFSSDTFECQDEAVRYDYDNGMFYATLGYVQNKLDVLNDNPQNQGSDGDYIDAYAGVRVAGFDLKAIVADYDDDQANGTSNTLLGAEVAYGGIENLNLSVGYYTVDRTVANVNEDNDTWALAADYTMGKWNFGTGYSDSSSDVANSDSSRWFVNAGYALAPATTAYVEFAGVDSDETLANDNLAAIGVKASF
ncbi:porin [Vibrio plantisponsor]|uniref:porin n=1 Tax=Vibrio plantisponsor TaxID=664643 RepID=UPI00370C1070